MALATLTIDINARLANIERDLGKAAHIAEKNGKKMEAAFAGAKAAFIGLGAALGAGTILSGIKTVIDGADQLQKASQKYGIAVEQLSALKYAGELSDVSLESIGKALKKLSVNMLDTAAGTGEARDAFKAMGISVTDAGGQLKTSDQVLGELADKFAIMEEGAGKTALAAKIMGERLGPDMLPLLNQGSKGLADMKKEAEALNVVIGGDLAQKSEEFNDNLTRIGVAADAFKIAIAQQALPVLNELQEGFIRQRKETGGLRSDFSLLGESLKGVVVFFGNVAFVLQGVGREIGGISAQIAALGRGDFEGFSTIGKLMKEDAAKARGDLDEWERRIMGAGAQSDTAGPAAKKAPAPLIPDSEKLKAAKKAIDEARKAMAEAAQAAYDNALAAAEADAQIEKLRNSYVDMVEPAAQAMRELRKFDEIAPALGLTAEQLERIRDTLQEKIDFEQYGKPLKDITDEVKKQNDLANDLGLTFQSAFEDAIVEGKKFSDVLKGLAQDILRIVIRRTVTERLGNALSEMLGNVMPSFGGGRAAGGPVHPGQYYVVGERGPEVLIPNTSGTVLPAGSSGGGGAQVTVNVINQTPAQVTTREHVTDGRREIMVLVQDAVSALMVGGAMDGVMRQTYGAGRVGALRG